MSEERTAWLRDVGLLVLRVGIVFLSLILIGAGRFSLDAVLRRKA